MTRSSSIAARLGVAVGTGVVLGSLGLVAPVAAAAPEFGTGPITVEAPLLPRTPRVVDVRWAEHRRFDRVVVDVRGRPPGYFASYVRRLTRDGSGDTVRVRGRHKFQLVLHPAQAHDRQGNSVYEGPRHRRIGLPTLKAMTFLGDFEGNVTFGFGVRSKPYRIFTLTHPSRVVVDFQHVG
jgi:hypothetical protein